jgi:hypothetical protein
MLNSQQLVFVILKFKKWVKLLLYVYMYIVQFFTKIQLTNSAIVGCIITIYHGAPSAEYQNIYFFEILYRTARFHVFRKMTAP